MNKEEFVEVIKLVVRDSALSSTSKVLNEPPGRKPKEELNALSDWFKNLSDYDKENLQRSLKIAVDLCVFGFFNVLDGDRTIESGPEKGELELYYVKDSSKVQLNELKGDLLHEIFQSIK